MKDHSLAVNKDNKPRAIVLTAVFLSLLCTCILCREDRKDNRNHKRQNVYKALLLLSFIIEHDRRISFADFVPHCLINVLKQDNRITF